MPRPRLLGKGYTRHHVVLYEGDFDHLRDLYPEMTPTEAIREIIHSTVVAKLGRGSTIDVDLEEGD